jgi:hypothetical protein
MTDVRPPVYQVRYSGGPKDGETYEETSRYGTNYPLITYKKGCDVGFSDPQDKKRVDDQGRKWGTYAQYRCTRFRWARDRKVRVTMTFTGYGEIREYPAEPW